MSETALENSRVENLDSGSQAPARRWLGLLPAWALSFWIGVMPRWSAGAWQRVPIWRAAIVAAGNLFAMGYWFLALLTVYDLQRNDSLRNPLSGNWSSNFGEEIRKAWIANWKDLELLFGRGVYTRTMAITALVLIVLIILGLVFFVLIPFAARPGRNRACIKHVTRATLLGTSFIHYWGAGLVGAFAAMIFFKLPPTGPWLTIALSVGCALALWTLWSLIRAVRVDYRGPGDLPRVIPSRCEACGYDLHLAGLEGKCPECGKPVAESLSKEHRQPTEWEREQKLRVGRAQLREVIKRPRELFSRMPTISGQPAAQKWMLLSMIAVGFFAALAIPLLTVLLKYGYVGRGAPRWARTMPEDIEWNSELFWLIAVGAVSLGILWAIFGMMMVGVETVGVVAVAHFRKNYVPLAAAAKVTCYASTLMFTWAIAGGLQILVVVMAYQQGWFKIHPLAEQIGLVATTAIAHIGGLLWFEWTVYRGLRGIQYANQ